MHRMSLGIARGFCTKVGQHNVSAVVRAFRYDKERDTYQVRIQFRTSSQVSIVRCELLGKGKRTAPLNHRITALCITRGAGTRVMLEHDGHVVIVRVTAVTATSASIAIRGAEVVDVF